MISFKKAMLRASLLLTFFTTFSYANYFYYDNVIQHPRFTQKMETLCSEVKEKTNWSLYIVAIDELNGTGDGKSKLFAYEKELSTQFEGDYVLFILAIKDMKVDITGSKGYEKQLDKHKILEEDVYPILGAKIKRDAKEKYLTAVLNGVGAVADEMAAHHNVTLENTIGNTNKNTLNVVRILFYGIIIFFSAIYLYRRFLKKRT